MNFNNIIQVFKKIILNILIQYHNLQIICKINIKKILNKQMILLINLYKHKIPLFNKLIHKMNNKLIKLNKLILYKLIK